MGGGAEADPLKSIRLGEEARSRLADFRKVAPQNGRLDADAASLDAAVARALERRCQAALRGQLTPEDRGRISDLLTDLGKGKNELLAKAATKAEEVYKTALASGSGIPKAFEVYLYASLDHFEALLKEAELLQPGSEERKKAGRKAADAIADWLKREAARLGSPLPEEIGVQMAVNFSFGYAWLLAGEPERAVAEFEKVVEVELPPGAPRVLRLKRLWSICLKARALSEMAEKSGKAEDWRKALGAILPEALTSDDPAVRVKARVLWARCLGRLGEANRAIEELMRILDDIEKLSPPFGND